MKYVNKLMLICILAVISSPIFSQQLGAFFKTENSLWGVMNEKEEIIIPNEYHHIMQTDYDGVGSSNDSKYISVPVEGFYRVKDNGRWYFLNSQGQKTFYQDFEFVSNFKNGVAIAQTATGYTLIDTTGTYLFDPIYQKIIDISEDILLTIDNLSRYGFANKTGTTITDNIYSEAFNFNSGYAAVKKGSWRFIDASGNLIRKGINETTGFTEGFACIKEKGNWQVIDKNFKPISNFTNLKFLEYSSGVFRFEQIDAIVCIDTSGSSLIIKDAKKMYPFKAGLAQIKKGSKWGIINTAGINVVAAEYDNIEICQNSYIRARKNGYWAYFSPKGDQITDFIFTRSYDFSEGLARVSTGNKYGYINENGELIIACQYDNAKDFKNGLCRVKGNSSVPSTENLGGWGYINKKGETVISTKYANTKDFFIIKE